MVKRCCAVFAAVVMGVLLYAGDVAHFIDIGFTPDGSAYAFAQYGIIDKTYQAYAEMYTVNVKTNSFLANGVFKTTPSAKTANMQGNSLYTTLFADNLSFMKKNAFPEKSNSVVLYSLAENTGEKKQIEFRDFEYSTLDSQISYKIRLSELIEGSGSRVVSAFYLILEKTDKNGTALTRTVVGNPQIKRQGVAGYRIYRVLSDAAGKNIVIVIEKNITEADGTSSIRYMVETVSLS